MGKRIITACLCVLLLCATFPLTLSASGVNEDDIVILYENDVHCAVEGYTKLSAMKKELLQSYRHVGVVSAGDYIQGASLGIISRGEYIVNLMNLVGYDALTLGNHEFDYKIERLEELIDMMNTKPISCNFQKVGESASYFDPYSIVSYGDVDIAYIGITAPSTITTSSPIQFKDENGNLLYTFHTSDIVEVVQASINSAKSAGADYIIAVAHVGYTDDEVTASVEVDILELIENTTGLDAVIDGHSHSVIEEMRVRDKDGEEVLLTSTGTKFAHVGKLTISNGVFSSELIPTEEYTGSDPAVDAYMQQIMQEYGELGNRVVARSEVDLVVEDPDGNRLVRLAETNLGDLCADAFRHAVNADIGFSNGGGIRANILAGDVTFNNLLNVFPYNNSIVLAEIDGQTIKDMLEMAMRIWPQENGSFPHLSGMTFKVRTDIPSSVVLNELDEFVSVDGEYRVYDIKVYNRETEKYEALRLDGTYTIASHNFFLLEYGSGMSMLKNAKILQNEGMLDVEALENYINDVLGGVIGEDYREMKPNITFTDGIENNDQWISIVAASAAVVAILGVVAFLVRRKIKG